MRNIPGGRRSDRGAKLSMRAVQSPGRAGMMAAIATSCGPTLPAAAIVLRCVAADTWAGQVKALKLLTKAVKAAVSTASPGDDAVLAGLFGPTAKAAIIVVVGLFTAIAACADLRRAARSALVALSDAAPMVVLAVLRAEITAVVTSGSDRSGDRGGNGGQSPDAATPGPLLLAGHHSAIDTMLSMCHDHFPLAKQAVAEDATLLLRALQLHLDTAVPSAADTYTSTVIPYLPALCSSVATLARVSPAGPAMDELSVTLLRLLRQSTGDTHEAAASALLPCVLRLPGGTTPAVLATLQRHFDAVSASADAEGAVTPTAAAKHPTDAAAISTPAGTGSVGGGMTALSACTLSPTSLMLLVRGILADSDATGFLLKKADTGRHRDCYAVTVVLPFLRSAECLASDSATRYLAIQLAGTWAAFVAAHTAQLKSFASDHECTALVGQLCEIVWSRWDDPTDRIRHQVLRLFDAALQLNAALAGGDGETGVSAGAYTTATAASKAELVAMARTLVAAMRRSVRGAYPCMGVLAGHLGFALLCEIEPELPRELLHTTGGSHQLAVSAATLIEVLIKVQLAGQPDQPGWNAVWAEPLTEVLQQTVNALLRRRVSQLVLPRLFKAVPTSVSVLIQRFGDTLSPEASGSAAPLNFGALAALVTVVRTAAGVDKTKTVLDETLVGRRHLVVAVSGLDPNLRLETLALVCESKRASSAVSPEGLVVVKEFLIYNATSQSPAFRANAVASVRKLLSRLVLSTAAIIKSDPKLELASTSVYLRDAGIFLSWYWGYLFRCLEPGTVFQRREFALQLIAATYAQTVTKSHPMAEHFLGSLLPVQVRLLLNCVSDAYESNRELAAALVAAHGAAAIQALDTAEIDDLVAHVLSLSRQTGAAHGSSAALLLQVLHGAGVALKLPPSGTAPVVGSADVFSGLLVELAARIATARASLIDAATNTPLHGILQSLRHLIAGVDYRAVVKSGVDGASNPVLLRWQQLLAKHIKLLAEVVDITFPVVSAASPEGFVPAEGGDIADSVYAATGTAQRVLVCCWRSMKEVGLAIDTIFTKVPLPAATATAMDASPLLMVSQAIHFGELLVELLSTARHRGAVDMLHVGFRTVCRTLWRSDHDTLRALPRVWLDRCLSGLATAEPGTVTRRSAGLPAIFLAVLGEVPSASKGTHHPVVLDTLIQLITIARDGRHNAARTHAINILKAVISNNLTGNATHDIIPEAVAIAIGGFVEQEWSIRNSSMMLFTSICGRVFGVKRVRDENATENKISARELFTRYPSMLPYFVRQLEPAPGIDVAGRNGGASAFGLRPEVYPVLVMLSKLSASDGVLSQDQFPELRALAAHVSTHRASPVLVVRQLAAVVSSIFVDSPACATVAIEQLQLVSTGAVQGANSAHGRVLAAKALLERTLAAPRAHVHMATLRSHALELLASVIIRYSRCCVVVHTAVEVCHTILDLQAPCAEANYGPADRAASPTLAAPTAEDARAYLALLSAVEPLLTEPDHDATVDQVSRSHCPYKAAMLSKTAPLHVALTAAMAPPGSSSTADIGNAVASIGNAVFSVVDEVALRGASDAQETTLLALARHGQARRPEVTKGAEQTFLSGSIDPKVVIPAVSLLRCHVGKIINNKKGAASIGLDLMLQTCATVINRSRNKDVRLETARLMADAVSLHRWPLPTPHAASTASTSASQRAPALAGTVAMAIAVLASDDASPAEKVLAAQIVLPVANVLLTQRTADGTLDTRIWDLLLPMLQDDDGTVRFWAHRCAMSAIAKTDGPGAAAVLAPMDAAAANLLCPASLMRDALDVVSKVSMFVNPAGVVAELLERHVLGDALGPVEVAAAVASGSQGDELFPAAQTSPYEEAGLELQLITAQLLELGTGPERSAAAAACAKRHLPATCGRLCALLKHLDGVRQSSQSAARMLVAGGEGHRILLRDLHAMVLLSLHTHGPVDVLDTDVATIRKAVGWPGVFPGAVIRLLQLVGEMVGADPADRPGGESVKLEEALFWMFGGSAAACIPPR